MTLILPLGFLLLQGAVLAFAPSIRGPAAYVLMVAAPLGAAAAAAWRAETGARPARAGWWAVAVSLAIWSLGAFGNLWHELVQGRQGEMYRDAMLAFNLAAVPITYLLASDWRTHATRRAVRTMDGAIALMLGYAYFVYTWAMLTARGSPDEAGVAYMVWLLDAQNLVLLVCALVRWYAADEPAERDLFRALSAYGGAYLVLLFANNHFVAGDPRFGPEYGTLITLGFALLAGLALWRPEHAHWHRPPRARVRAVRGASPALLAAALLILSLFLIRVDYPLGAAGVLVAVLGYGLRTVLAQVGHIAREDLLQQETSALQQVAWTDALTGVPNRGALEQALATAWRHARRAGQPLAVLMIDIDHFKLLNDRYGHPTGDACLRSVARALQQALVRPGDLLARYGGEEFIALLADADLAAAQLVGERLRAEVEALAIAHAGSDCQVVTVSIGVASALVQDAAGAGALVAAADEALYAAKCAGRNRLATQQRAVAGG